MTEVTLVISFLTLLVGWLLSEASNRRREISSDRRAISRAISDLLEVRYRVFFLKGYIDEVTKRFKIPQEARPIIMGFLDNILPSTDDLQKRFNESVDAVASAKPLLGFQLRSKDELPKYLKLVRQLASQDPNAAQLYPQLEAQLMNIIKSPIDDFILELAKVHGWLTWWKVRKYLREPLMDKERVDKFLSGFESITIAASQGKGDGTRSGV